jgi:hypothetical protein
MGTSGRVMTLRHYQFPGVGNGILIFKASLSLRETRSIHWEFASRKARVTQMKQACPGTRRETGTRGFMTLASPSTCVFQIFTQEKLSEHLSIIIIIIIIIII